MFVGRTLYILGLIFVFFSILFFIMAFFNNDDLLFPLFGLLNGFIAMGIGDLVIDMNHKNRMEAKREA
ncbi:hypothetical protein [Bacillus alkalisoli]|uniref:hypothetical protein n=1 Tax=Bacillus alkalisoli TaxID=2011008 RepID=UPI000C237210|nr:hypothetical protein [Bacillus alkalisoli]